MSGVLDILANPILAIIILLASLIIVHEAVHFIMAKLFKVPVEVFSIGFGPTLLKFRLGETIYKLALVPLGGYVKFYGMTLSEDIPSHLSGTGYCRVSPLIRMAITFGGPFANLILAVVTFAAMGYHGMPQLPSVIGEVMKNSPAAEAGLISNDKIISINDKSILTWSEVQKRISQSSSEKLKVSVERSGKILDMTLVPNVIDDDEGISKRGQIGITPGRIPAIITLTKLGSLDGVAQLKTGDRIKAVVFANGSFPIRYWSEFVSSLYEANRLDQSLRIIIERQGAENHSVDRTITLAPLLGKKKIWEKRELLSEYGFMDSQLTISQVDLTHTNRVTTEQNPELLNQNSARKMVTYQFLRAGDRLLEWNKQKIEDVFDYVKITSRNKSSFVSLKILREGRELVYDILLDPIEVQRVEGRTIQYRLPVQFLGELIQPEPIIEKYTLINAISYGYRQTFEQSIQIGEAVVGLITGHVPLKALGGPISIGKVASDSVKMGWLTYLTVLALISINLALLNLIPIPVLDGGQMVLQFIELIYGKALPDVALENFQKIGFILVLALVVMATYNDLSRFWASMVSSMMGIIQ